MKEASILQKGLLHIHNKYSKARGVQFLNQMFPLRTYRLIVMQPYNTLAFLTGNQDPTSPLVGPFPSLHAKRAIPF